VRRRAYPTKAATRSRLLLAVEGGHADEVDVSEGIDNRTDLPANGRSAAVPEPVSIAERPLRLDKSVGNHRRSTV
jgi:hypothetical protein